MLEVIVQNGEEAKQAEKLGADRMELVSAIKEGGLTPSYGMVKQVLESASVPVQVMVRPHSYHYCYTDSDMEVVLEDIMKIVELGGTRIVFGVLNIDHTINEQILKKIIEEFPQLDITFHRAFDEVPSQKEAYRILTKYKQNVKRILTSGGEDNCLDGKERLQELVDTANELGGPEIMPGAGLSPVNIQAVHAKVNANHYHFGKALRVDQSFVNTFNENAFKFVVGCLKNGS